MAEPQTAKRPTTVSSPQYREITEIVGTSIRKSIEVALHEVREGEDLVGYRAIHRLPTERTTDPASTRGEELIGDGRTEQEALTTLGRIIFERYNTLDQASASELDWNGDVQRRYLRSLFLI